MKCRHETPVSKRCLKTQEIDPCPGYDKCKEFQPDYKTNADHIRSMTDEELAKFPFLECPYIVEPYGECKYGWHDPEQTCEECMLEWLKQPYKEEVC